MAQLTDGILFTGSIGGFSAYTMRGSDKIIVRSKGGPSKALVKKSPTFANTRKNNNEWAGCTKAGQAFREAISGIRHVADYNISGPINGIAKIIQKEDTEHVHGERGIYFSSHRELLTGFSVNRNRTFESVVRVPIAYSVVRETGIATITIPALWPQIHVNNLYNYPLCRFIVSFGIVSDMVYNEKVKLFQPINQNPHNATMVSYSDWKNTKQPFDAESINLCFNSQVTITDSDSLVLAIGIEFGNPLTDKLVEPIKYSGSAKVFNVS